MPAGECLLYLAHDEIKGLRNRDFEKESGLVDYLELNIQRFTEEILEDRLVDYRKEYQFTEGGRFGPRLPRIDLYIMGESKNYLIECKNPKQPAECRVAIGQLLNYGRKFEGRAELVLVSTMYDDDTAKTIGHWNLPIKFIYFEKEKALIYKGEWG